MKSRFASAMTMTAVLAAIWLTGACSHVSSPSPVSPSATAAATASPSPSSDRVHVDGAISSINQAARSLQVTTTTVVVPAGVALATSGGQIEFKDLQVEMQVHVVGTVQPNGVVSAQEVQVEDKGKTEPQPNPGAENETEFTGSIASLGGSCPSLTLSINGKMVKTNSGTTFLKAACSALSARDLVEIKGTTQTDGSVMALRVQMDDDVAEPKPEPEPEPEPGETEVEFTGTVSSVMGACPQLTLGIAGRTVNSTSATEFKNGSCGDVRANATTLQVKGMAAKDGVVTAARLAFEK